MKKIFLPWIEKYIDKINWNSLSIYFSIQGKNIFFILYLYLY